MTQGKTMVAVLLACIIAAAIAGAVPAQKQGVPKPQDEIALGERNAVALLQLMDTDKNGKISKQEWMQFMEKEFDRLDKDKNGELDPKELRESILFVHRQQPSEELGK
jgi:Ca2+-binding EF-hand superfamily protein